MHRVASMTTRPELARYDQADLTVVFPELTSEQVGRIHGAAARVEAVRPPKGRTGWDWWPESVGSEERLLIFGTSMIYDDGKEFNLFIQREERSRVSVSVTLDVQCECEKDHAGHTVRKEEWLVGTAEALCEAFESTAETLVRWAADGRDAGGHRKAAGLPSM